MNKEFWRGRRIFLTGHTGFKGSWLSLMLQSLGAELHGYALAPVTEPSLFRAAGVDAGMASRIGDIRDLADLRRALEAARPEIVIHMAAQAIVSESYTQPLDTFSVNVLGTANLLETIRDQQGVKAVLIVTSDKCYDNREWLWAYRENEALGGKDPYSASKACAELVAASYRHAFYDGPGRAVIATARAGNVIGGGDWSPDRLIPDIARAFSSGESALIRSPRAVRPWQHVLEPLSGYLSLAEACAADPAFGQAWNFGPDPEDTRSVGEVAHILAGVWGEGCRWHAAEENPVREAGVLKLDSTKARTLLQWRPRLDLKSALRLTAQWYKGYAAGKDPRALTEAQVHDYMERS